MKVILCLLAVLCSALADHHEHGHGEPGHQHHEHEMDPCLTQCRETIKAKLAAEPALANFAPDRLTTPEGRTKMREHIRKYISGTASPPSAVSNPEMWTKMCTIATETETCVNACPESPKREGVKKFLGLFKLGCDEDFKSSIGCLADFAKTPNQACQDKCVPLASKLSDFLTQRDANPTERTPAPKDVLESGCKFTNCRLNCRKTEIVNKCQEKGFEQAKKLWSAMATSSKMLYKRGGGDLANWPDACKSDKIVEAHEY